MAICHVCEEKTTLVVMLNKGPSCQRCRTLLPYAETFNNVASVNALPSDIVSVKKKRVDSFVCSIIFLLLILFELSKVLLY